MVLQGQQVQAERNHTHVVRDGMGEGDVVGEGGEDGRGRCTVDKHRMPVVAVEPMVGGSCCNPWPMDDVGDFSRYSCE